MPDEMDIIATCATPINTTVIRRLGTNGEIIEYTELGLAHYTVKEYLLSEVFQTQRCPFIREAQLYSHVA